MQCWARAWTVIQRMALIIGVVFLAADAGWSFSSIPGQFFRSYLYAYIYCLGLSIGWLGILLMHHTVGGKWGVVIRRLLESGARTFPLMAVLLVPVLFGMTSLYLWARPEIVVARQGHQMEIRLPECTVLPGADGDLFRVCGCSTLDLESQVLEQDRTAIRRLMLRMRQISAPGLVVFAHDGDLRFLRPDHVAGAPLVLDDLRSDVPDRPDAGDHSRS